MSDKYTIEIKKRPWYEWLLWALWAFLTIFSLQNAMASGAELESTSATIFWVVSVIFILGGAIVWYIRRDN